MLESLRKRFIHSQASHESKLKQLTKELTEVQQRSQKLYEAVEKGLLPEDSTLTERANKLQARRQALLTEIARLRRDFWRKEGTGFHTGLTGTIIGKRRSAGNT